MTIMMIMITLIEGRADGEGAGALLRFGRRQVPPAVFIGGNTII